MTVLVPSAVSAREKIEDWPLMLTGRKVGQKPPAARPAYDWSAGRRPQAFRRTDCAGRAWGSGHAPLNSRAARTGVCHPPCIQVQQVRACRLLLSLDGSINADVSYALHAFLYAAEH